MQQCIMRMRRKYVSLRPPDLTGAVFFFHFYFIPYLYFIPTCLCPRGLIELNVSDLNFLCVFYLDIVIHNMYYCVYALVDV